MAVENGVGAKIDGFWRVRLPCPGALNAVGGCGDGGGVQAAAEEDADARGVQTIGDCGIPDRKEIFDVIVGARVADAAVDRDVPIAAKFYGIAGNEQSVRGRQALNVAESGGGVIAVEAEEQEIGDSGIVQRGGYTGVKAESVEGVAKEKKRVEERVVERLDAEVIASAEERLGVSVPDGEGEIPAKMLDAIGTPLRVSVEE